MGFTRKLLTAKGDLLTRDAAQLVRLAPGTDGQVLTADAAQAKGIKWAAAPGLTGPNAYSYYSYTDASNYQGLKLSSDATSATFGAATAGTGADNLDVNITPAGTGRTRANGALLIGAVNGNAATSAWSAYLNVNSYLCGVNNVTIKRLIGHESTYGSVSIDVDSAGVTLGTSSLLAFGGKTASVPALKRSGAELQCRLGSDTAYADFHANKLFLGTNACNISPSSVLGTLDITSVQGVQIVAGGNVHGFDAWGNVGIGTPNPTAKLDVAGSIALSGIIGVQGTQVITSQQPAIPDATGGTVEATLNALLASLRTHGLIAA